MDVEERRVLLDKHYNIVKKQLLQYQSGSIGLFPLYTSGNSEESHIRDSIYCAIGTWSLALAHRHLDDSQGRTYELQQSAVKCMRGILFCWMRQADKVEHFKRNQLGHLSLHSKFNINTGDTVCSDSEWGHLQIDAVALYLLTLVQMTTSGLQIIYTTDEVNFIQNLVYYIERAYRTPDYGMWERGTKENNGTKELQSCSIGMAKAALEAINGFNAYGAQGTSSSVIYVDPDAHNRNVTILNSLLPRASSSKVTDASLLTILGFPAFVVDDEALKQETRKLVIDKLEGKYGLKRFPKDGFMTVLEDKNRRYYEKEELERFDGIECEWPLFFIYLALDAIFRNDRNALLKYTRILREDILVNSEEGDLLPKYFYVPKMYLDKERDNPHSQVRLGNEVENEGFLWGQSMLILLNLLVEGLLDVSEIDPIGRHLFQTAKSRRYASMNFRYSSFQIAESDPVVQVILISESKELQATLAMFGIETETPEQIDPIQLWPPGQLVKAYERLGVNRKLGLQGRPSRPIGALGTSKIYRILGRTVVTYPKLLDESDFYMSLDMSLVIDEIKSTLAFVRNNWHLRGRPTFTIFLREQRLRGKHFPEMLEMLASFKRGQCNGIKIRMGKLQTLVSTACVDHLDFLQRDEPISHLAAESEQLGFEVEVITEEITPAIKRPQSIPRSRGFTLSRGYSTTVAPSETTIHCDKDDGRDLVTKSREGLVAELHDCPNENRKMLILQELLNREGKFFVLPGDMGTVVEQIEDVYKQSGYDRKWNVVRRGAGLLGKLADSLAPGITTILVRGKVVTIGVFGHEERVIYEPLTPAAIQKIIYSYCSPHDVRETVLQQEMVLYLASFISTMPELFKGMLKIRVGWIIQAMKIQLALCAQQAANFGSVYCQSPSNVKRLLMIVLTSKGRLHGYSVAPRTPLDHRQLDGAVHRTPADFYEKVWHILARAPSGLKISRHVLPQLPTITELSHDEKNFALKVEELLSDISSPEYRQIVIELLMVLATMLGRNPEVQIDKCIDLDGLVEDAIEMFRMDTDVDKNQDRQQFYNLPATGKGGTMTYLTRAVVNQLLEGGVSLSSEHPCVVS